MCIHNPSGFFLTTEWVLHVYKLVRYLYINVDSHNTIPVIRHTCLINIPKSVVTVLTKTSKNNKKIAMCQCHWSSNANIPSAWWTLTVIWTLRTSSNVIYSSAQSNYNALAPDAKCKYYLSVQLWTWEIHLWNMLLLLRTVILWCIPVEFGSRAGWDISRPSDLTISKYLETEGR